ncbi:hypothetical protein JQX09_17770 [Sulfitobacter pseudonitzschiae]|uniref:Uncharacterized protein n=1 Tax=Pseudosulfitobacter pseudonitzschiae TaxID=1402135 RepID=A0A9Q2RTS8_9RHOB|nr:hypothetical protein [Pseudosulfitobacter pseudonitzschiae]MBM2293779.1 hypothetical protein [Pseudosulfitobacter pseudonitzschiae]MBM2298697.1 hypothetical protein [Pseudosulfitobacter pseudonitzschiae]MBM2303611.1 hypothetical protein [Pseudosulfitobacter pseudonitzschiae]MBM2313394.1 hypothetical protein [Pseudosulfitobacter pseudonitzschiae]MBM2318307.1 hypothetical protein [Pseudosulfitobacter pseudonitzschiae]
MTETREVFAVISNTDLTEGRGRSYVKAYCETSATARRLAHKGYVQGGNCPIEKRTLYKPEGQNSWLGPVTVEIPTDEDRRQQVALDAQSAALEKARAFGLSEDEIKMLRTATI